MRVMNACRKCGAAVCACGFAATLAVSVLAGGNPPPPRVVGPILAQLNGSVGTMLPSVYVSDQITGTMYSAAWLDQQKQRKMIYSANPPPAVNFSALGYHHFSTASIVGSIDVVFSSSLLTISSKDA